MEFLAIPSSQSRDSPTNMVTIPDIPFIILTQKLMTGDWRERDQLNSSEILWEGSSGLVQQYCVMPITKINIFEIFLG